VEVHPPAGETLCISERVVVAPSIGIFRRLDGDAQVKDGDTINRGDVIGIVQSLGVCLPVQSPFMGLLVGILAFEGERVRPGQPLAWLRVV
jgi:acetyl-CoA carboxylase biotin carboxyl carrier protein